jgi:hypothetical protein
METGEKKEKKEKGLAQRIKLFFKKDFFKNEINLWLSLFGLLANAVNWMIIAIFIRKVDAGLIFHYNVYFGVDAFGKWKEFFVFPSAGAIVFVFNFFLAFLSYQKKERIAGYVLLLAGVMFQVGLLIASAGILIINY